MSWDLLANDVLDRVRREHHPRCFVCRDEGFRGLGVRFELRDDGGVEATAVCPASWEGYTGLVHGGIITSLMDGAMVNALFAREVVAVTVDLQIRFRAPLPLGQTVTIVGEVTRFTPFISSAEARVVSGTTVYATATGRFMPRGEG
jgi:uncharacterized protein (TIGR00369 family)